MRKTFLDILSLYKSDKTHLKQIMAAITIAGVIEVLCIIFNIISGNMIHNHYNEKIGNVYAVSSYMNDLSQYGYQYQSIMMEKILNINSSEDYQQELNDIVPLIESKFSDTDKLIEQIKSEQLSSVYTEYKNSINGYLKSGKDDITLQETSSLFKRCTSNYGLVILYLERYIDDCYQSLFLSDIISVILNVLIACIAVVTIIICRKRILMFGEQLEILKEKADVANYAKSAFLANMSHEIRTPINAVLSMNEMILRESHEKASIEYATDIKKAGTTLLSIINDILDMSKIESGKLSLIPDNYCIQDLINDETVMLKPKAEEKGLEFLIIYDHSLPSVLYGDMSRIKQIVTNITNNAIKYTETGSVTLEYGFRVSEKETFLTIKVTDTGIGIKEEDIKKLYSKFERIEEERNKNIEGTGLGMSIVKQLIDMMGGEIKVESVYGKGSSFTVEIPQMIVDMTPVREISSQDTEEEYSPEFTAPDADILVVDDNAMNRKAFVLLLKRTMVQIDTGESGEESISLCRKKKYDIVFLDHRMPGMDGVETLSYLKDIFKEQAVQTPVIMLTANALSGAKEEYQRIGFSDFLSKPVDPKKLEEMVWKYLPQEKRNVAANTNTFDCITEYQSKEKNTDKDEKAEPREALKLFDYDEAISHCNDREIFTEMVSEYVKMYPMNKNKLEALYQTENYEEYRILVHSIKSTSRMIGLMLLGKMAEAEEYYASHGYVEKIKDSFYKFMDTYEKSIVLLKENYYQNEEVCVCNALSKEKTEAYIVRLTDAISMWDINELDSIMKEMKKYDYPGKTDLEDAIMTLDYDKALTILGNIS